jgi:hypothetical protein
MDFSLCVSGLVFGQILSGLERCGSCTLWRFIVGSGEFGWGERSNEEQGTRNDGGQESLWRETLKRETMCFVGMLLPEW